MRIIKNYNGNFEGHQESWKQVMNKASFDIMKQLAIAVRQFFESYSFKQLAPFHIAAEKGSLELCQEIINKTKDKNPSGNLSIDESRFRLGFDAPNNIYEIEKSSTKIDCETTPLHISAMNGNIELCRLIIENIKAGYNPKNTGEFS